MLLAYLEAYSLDVVHENFSKSSVFMRHFSPESKVRNGAKDSRILVIELKKVGYCEFSEMNKSNLLFAHFAMAVYNY